MKVAGVMSGTSLDGIDVAIVEIEGRKIEPIAFQSAPYPKAVRTALLAVSNAAAIMVTAIADTLRSAVPSSSAKCSRPVRT